MTKNNQIKPGGNVEDAIRAQLRLVNLNQKAEIGILMSVASAVGIKVNYDEKTGEVTIEKSSEGTGRKTDGFMMPAQKPSIQGAASPPVTSDWNEEELTRKLAPLIKSAIISTLEDNPPKAIVDSSVHLENNCLVMTILERKYKEWVTETCSDVASKMGKVPARNVVAQYGDDVCLAVPDEENVVAPEHPVGTTEHVSWIRHCRLRLSHLGHRLYEDMTSSLRKVAAYIICMCAVMVSVSLGIKNYRMNTIVKEYGILKPVLLKHPYYGPFIHSLDSALVNDDIDEIIREIQVNQHK